MTLLTRRFRCLLAVAAVAVTAACSSATGSSAGPTTSAAPPAASTAASPSATGTAAPAPLAAPTIVIHDFRYAVPASVPAGARLTVHNRDGQTHTVTLGGGSSAKVVVQGGGTATLTAPGRPGRYPVTCDFHGDMHAVLVVV